jgi:alpha-glucosidase
MRWLDAPDGALAFARDPGFACLVNVSADAVALPEGAEVVLASGPLTDDGAVGPDTAVWLRSSGS